MARATGKRIAVTGHDLLAMWARRRCATAFGTDCQLRSVHVAVQMVTAHELVCRRIQLDSAGHAVPQDVRCQAGSRLRARPVRRPERLQLGQQHRVLEWRVRPVANRCARSGLLQHQALGNLLLLLTQ